MSKEVVICPVCKYNQGVKKERISSSMEHHECPVCGEYEMPVFAPEVHGATSPNRKLSAWIREQNERGELVQFNKKAMIENVLASIPDYSPPEKQLRLLQAIAKKSRIPGAEIILSCDKDIPLAYCSSSKELAFYLEALEERRLLKKDIWKVKITSRGWDYVDKHTSDLEEKTQAFVAMSFSDAMRPMWDEAIKPAIQGAGYTPYRVDEDPHSDNIIFKIMAEIKNSRFLVADITEQRNGVYFEAGYALGSGLPVIWSVRRDDADNVHFDTAQYNQIRWGSAEELRECLFDYICAIIGQRNRAQA